MSKLKISRRYLILAAFAGFLVCIDQLTKMYIHTQFLHGDSIPVIHNFFSITYVRNPGAAFGIFRDAHEAFRSIFFLSVPLIAMIIILNILRGVKETDRLQIFALSAIFGGALGNYIDRIRFSYVIDFLDFQFPYNLPMIGQGIYTYPAFNVADMAIVCGVTLLVFILARETWNERKAKLKTAHAKRA